VDTLLEKEHNIHPFEQVRLFDMILHINNPFDYLIKIFPKYPLIADHFAILDYFFPETARDFFKQYFHEAFLLQKERKELEKKFLKYLFSLIKYPNAIPDITEIKEKTEIMDFIMAHRSKMFVIRGTNESNDDLNIEQTVFEKMITAMDDARHIDLFDSLISWIYHRVDDEEVIRVFLEKNTRFLDQISKFIQNMNDQDIKNRLISIRNKSSILMKFYIRNTTNIDDLVEIYEYIAKEKNLDKEWGHILEELATKIRRALEDNDTKYQVLMLQHEYTTGSGATVQINIPLTRNDVERYGIIDRALYSEVRDLKFTHVAKNHIIRVFLEKLKTGGNIKCFRSFFSSIYGHTRQVELLFFILKQFSNEFGTFIDGMIHTEEIYDKFTKLLDKGSSSTSFHEGTWKCVLILIRKALSEEKSGSGFKYTWSEIIEYFPSDVPNNFKQEILESDDLARIFLGVSWSDNHHESILDFIKDLVKQKGEIVKEVLKKLLKTSRVSDLGANQVLVNSMLDYDAFRDVLRLQPKFYEVVEHCVPESIKEQMVLNKNFIKDCIVNFRETGDFWFYNFFWGKNYDEFKNLYIKKVKFREILSEMPYDERLCRVYSYFFPKQPIKFVQELQSEQSNNLKKLEETGIEIKNFLEKDRFAN
jgi:hypothetical protein